MTVNIQHPLALIVAGRNAYGKSTFVIRMLKCREQLCDTVYKNIVWYYSEKTHRITCKTFHLLKAYQILKTLKIYLLLWCWMILWTLFIPQTSALFLLQDHIIVTLLRF